MAEQEHIKLSNGVELYDPEDFDFVRKRVFDTAHRTLVKSFPMSFNGMRMELTDTHYSDPETYDISRQKEAIMGDEFLARRLRGTVSLYDENSKQLVDQRKLTLMRVPYVTERGTVIHGGNEYGVSKQARLIPGAYSRKQASGDVEAQFNIRSGTGRAFRVAFEPHSAQYRFRVKGSNLHLYSLLNSLGVPDDQLKEKWGEDVLNKNKEKFDARVLGKAYQHMVPKQVFKADASNEEKAEAVRKALDDSKISRESAEITMPGLLGKKEANAWRAAMNKKAAAQDRLPFAPDMPAIDAHDAWCLLADPAEIVKVASADFAPDLDSAEMKEPYDAIYGKVGPQLAAMKQWPSHWFQEGDNPLGWIDWYRKYADGARNPAEDERQVRRWKSFKARHAAQFVKNPTPRRAYALRYWAIDPVKLLPDDESRSAIRKEMQDYRDNMLAQHMAVKDTSGVVSPLSAK